MDASSTFAAELETLIAKHMALGDDLDGMVSEVEAQLLALEDTAKLANGVATED